MKGVVLAEPMRKTQSRTAERERRRHVQEQKQRLWRTLAFVGVGLLVAIGVGLVLYGTLQPGANITGANGPRLQLDREQIDFGDQHFNNPVRASFKVTNAGDGTLTLNAPKVASVVEGC